MRKLFVIGMLVCFCLNLQAQKNSQEAMAETFQTLEVEGRLLLFLDELNSIAADVMRSDQAQLKKADKKLLAIDYKWMVYSQSNQETIAADEELMNIVASYQENKQMVADSIQGRRHQLESFDVFREAEKFTEGQLSEYQEMFEASQQYALLKQQASLLEKLKVKEQLIFSELTGHYEVAKTVSEEYPVLNSRMEKLEEQYVELKGMSEKIQAAEYKPFLERIKDYLYSFAAVAILLMFFNMVQSKIQAYKQMRKSADEYKKMLQQNDNEYPTI